MPRGRPVLSVGLNNDPRDSVVYPWFDLSMDVIEGYHSRRGRTASTIKYDTGTFSTTLTNKTGVYSPAWTAGPYYGKLIPRRPLKFEGEYPWFLDSPPLIQGLFTGAITWTGTNCSLARVATPTYTGLGAMRMAASSAANMSAKSTAINVSPGQIWAASARYRSDTFSRTVRTDLEWRNSSNVLLSTTTGATVVDDSAVWTRAGVSGTAPANAAFMYVIVNVLSPGLGEQHNIDAVPVDTTIAGFEGVFPLYYGFVDGWQQDFDNREHRVMLTASDAFKFFGGVTLRISDWEDARSAGCTDYWQLDEHYADISQTTNGGAAANILDSTRPGSYSATPGPMEFDQPGYKNTEDGAVLLRFNQAGDSGGWGVAFQPTRASTGAFSVGFAFNMYQELVVSPTISYPALTFQQADGTNHVFSITVTADGSGGNGLGVTITVRTKTTGSSTELVISQQINNLYSKGWHRLFVTRASNGTTIKLYVDGTLRATGTATSVTNMSATSTGSMFGTVTSGNGISGIRLLFDNIETATSEYTSTQISDREGFFDARHSQDRAYDLMKRAGWPTAMINADPDPDAYYVQAMGAKGDTLNLLDYLQLLQETEGGQFFMAADGKARYITGPFSDNSPYNTSQATFGIGAGEYPYEEAITSDDDRMLWNQAEITIANHGSAMARDQTSINKYFLSDYPYGKGLLFNLDLSAAQTRANGIVAKYKDPKSRLDRVRIFPGVDPALWKLIFTLEIWSRITVKVTNPGNPAVPQSYVCQIVGIEHDALRGEWYTTYHLSTQEANF